MCHGTCVCDDQAQRTLVHRGILLAKIWNYPVKTKTAVYGKHSNSDVA